MCEACCSCAHFPDEESEAQGRGGPQPRCPDPQASRRPVFGHYSPPPARGSTRVPAGHCCLLSPCGRRFLGRVLCPRPAARRPAARAGLFPTQGPPVPSRLVVQAEVARAKGPLAAQPGSDRRARGRAGHTPLGCCPAVPGPVGHAWGCSRLRLSGVGKLRHRFRLRCGFGHPQSWQAGGAPHMEWVRPQGKG